MCNVNVVMSFLKCIFYFEGIYGSSVHLDGKIKGEEFIPFVFNGSATPIKTHKWPNRIVPSLEQVKKVILILRDPFDALKVEYERITTSKTSQLTDKRQLSGIHGK